MEPNASQRDAFTVRVEQHSADFERHWQQAMAGAAAQAITAPRCPLMPAEAHCWHEQLRLWDDPFPLPVQCCWCGLESVAAGAVPRRHGPCVPEG